ncbi:MAG TPA: zinc ABC transporter substrate-binding protein [Candidatus Sumerlaeota bacterium]|nr:zinc ABC transporter substrate-binding protein [Candidatus Sumerlaeota bacterium]
MSSPRYEIINNFLMQDFDSRKPLLLLATKNKPAIDISWFEQMKKRVFSFQKYMSLCALGVFILLLAACNRIGEKRKRAEGEPLRVLCTTSIAADLAGNIAGGRALVAGLMGAGTDPHLYKASEGDVIRMAQADIIFYNGLHLEGRMTDIFEKMSARGIPAVALSDGVPKERLLALEGARGVPDPHIWFDVSLWMLAAQTVRDALVEHDPPNALFYRENADKYLKELEALHTYIKTEAEKIPAERRALITAHDAFGYFGRAYDFEVMGLQGISTSAEVGARDVRNLAALIVRRRIPAVFVETSVPSRNIEALQAAVRARGFHVKTGAHLYSDALGLPNTPQGSYIGMARHNIDSIVKAFLDE